MYALTLALSLRREREVILKELPLTPSSKKRGKRKGRSKRRPYTLTAVIWVH
jgi:hypothetical protein